MVSVHENAILGPLTSLDDIGIDWCGSCETDLSVAVVGGGAGGGPRDGPVSWRLKTDPEQAEVSGGCRRMQ